MRIVRAFDRFRSRPRPFGRRPMDRRDRRAPIGWVPLALAWRKRRKPLVDTLAPVAGAVTQVINLIQVHPAVVREQMHYAVMRLPSPAGPGAATRSSTPLGRETETPAAMRLAFRDHGIVSSSRAVNQQLALEPLAGVANGRDGSQQQAAIGRRAPIPTASTHGAGVAARPMPAIPSVQQRSGGPYGNGAAAIRMSLGRRDRQALFVKGGPRTFPSAQSHRPPEHQPYPFGRHRTLRRAGVGVPDETQTIALNVKPAITGPSKPRAVRDPRLEMQSATMSPETLDWRKPAGTSQRGQTVTDAGEAVQPVVGRNADIPTMNIRTAVPAAATVFDPAVVDRLADDVIRRIERRGRIERERRGL